MSEALSSLVEKMVLDKLYYLQGNKKFLIVSDCELHIKEHVLIFNNNIVVPDVAKHF
jgi:hypothetical protein